jgi:hypothetical protein
LVRNLTRSPFSPFEINEEFIERVDSFKLLGVIFSSDLSWGQHVSYMLNKISKRYYLIFELSRIGIPHHEIILIYCAIIRSVLEYARAVWHSGLTTAQHSSMRTRTLYKVRVSYVRTFQKIKDAYRTCLLFLHELFGALEASVFIYLFILFIEC